MTRATLLASLAFAMLASFTGPVALADQFQLNVIQCNCLPVNTIAGTVTLTQQTSNQVEVTVQLSSGLSLHDEGLTTFSFNVSGVSSLSLVSAFTGSGNNQVVVLTNGATQGGPYSLLTPPNADGLHTFQFGLECNGGSNGCPGDPTTLQFEVTGNGTLSMSQFETTDNGNSVTDFSANVAGTGSCTTGVVGAGSGTGQSTGTGGFSSPSSCSSPPVPEPTSIAFFGSGLIGLGFVLRKKFSRS